MLACPRAPIQRSPVTGLVDDTQDRAVIVEQRDQRAKGRASGDEGTRAVDRVQNPAQRRLGPVEAEFFAHYPMVRETFGQHCAYRQFGGAVGDRHRRLVSLQNRGEARAEEGTDDRPGDIGGGFGGRDQRVGVRDHFAGSGTGSFDRVRR